MKVLPFRITKTAGESFTVQVDDSHYFYNALHQHEEIQITYILKSEGSLIVGNYVGNFMPGDLFVIGSGQPHVFRNYPEYFIKGSRLQAHCISIFVHENLLGESFLNLPETKHFKQLIMQAENGLVIKGKDKLAIGKMIMGAPVLKGVSRITWLINLFDRLAKARGKQVLSNLQLSVSNESDGERLNKIYQYSLNNLTLPIPLKKIAEVANMSESSFCRYFKKRTRKTYSAFINELRLNKACEHLKKKENPISEIGFISGFNNLSNFNRQFKKIIGKTPKEYRQAFFETN